MSYLYRILEVLVRFVLPLGTAAFASAALIVYVGSRQVALAIPSALLFALALVWLWISNTRKARRRWRESSDGIIEDTDKEHGGDH